MAIVTTTTIGGGLIKPDSETLRRYYLQTRQAVAKRRIKYTKADKEELVQNSLIGQTSQAWNNLTQADKDDWSASASIISGIGYNLFTADKSYRIKNSISGNATPSLYHHYLVGHLQIAELAGDVRLQQMGYAVLTSPMNLSISYKSSLSVNPSNGEYLKVAFSYYYTSGESTLKQTDELSLNLSQAWTTVTLPITEQANITGDWELLIDCHAIHGDIWFDDFYVSSPGGIFTKDWQCEQVQKKWGLVLFPAGCVIETIYPTGSAL